MFKITVTLIFVLFFVFLGAWGFSALYCQEDVAICVKAGIGKDDAALILAIIAAVLVVIGMIGERK